MRAILDGVAAAALAMGTARAATTVYYHAGSWHAFSGTLPDGTQVGVVMQVGLSQPWNAQATGHGASLAWSMARSDINAFDQQFRHADSMTLSFPSGNEPLWTVSLIGSTAADNTFARCIMDLTRRQQAQQSAASTQPFGQGRTNGAPTQPFGQASGTATPTKPPSQ